MADFLLTSTATNRMKEKKLSHKQIMNHLSFNRSNSNLIIFYGIFDTYGNCKNCYMNIYHLNIYVVIACSRTHCPIKSTEIYSNNRQIDKTAQEKKKKKKTLRNRKNEHRLTKYNKINCLAASRLTGFRWYLSLANEM